MPNPSSRATRRAGALRYELHYWSGIPGRGEFVRLAFEEAGVAFRDLPFDGTFRGKGLPPFAPPFLKVGDLVIAQTANILQFLAPRLGLVPRDESSRLAANQLQLTLADLVAEIHEAHHPIASSLYYQDQRPVARRRTAVLLRERLPKFLAYFERVLVRNRTGYLVGARRSYPDLSLFHVVAGLRYAFPRAMKRLERKAPRVVALHARLAARPRIAAYLASPRRRSFNEHGLFRHYPSLDQ